MISSFFFIYLFFLIHGFYCRFYLWVLIPLQVLKSQLFVDKFSESIQQTFLDYLAGGYEMNFMVAVDFTGYYLLVFFYNKIIILDYYKFLFPNF